MADQGREEYIEAELAKRHAAEARAAAIANGETPPTEPVTNPATTEAATKQTAQPEMQGKLMEIDLGDEARARNIAMTERARRKALGEAVDDEDESGSSRPRKVRLGRDGKPWRGRKRRNSEDIKRDQLVEEFLKENRRESSPLSYLCF